jgi:hypothetical protein
MTTELRIEGIGGSAGIDDAIRLAGLLIGAHFGD